MGLAPSVIVSGARTPIGKFRGAFAGMSAVDLGAIAIGEALTRSGVAADQVDYVVMGQVIRAGTGQITARRAAIAAGIPKEVPALNVDKVCLSGTTAIALADQMIRAGEVDLVVAGGMESMTQAPYSYGAEEGRRLGHAEMIDAVISTTDSGQHSRAGHWGVLRRSERRARHRPSRCRTPGPRARTGGRTPAGPRARSPRRSCRSRSRGAWVVPYSGSNATRGCRPGRLDARVALRRPGGRLRGGWNDHRGQRIADQRRRGRTSSVTSPEKAGQLGLEPIVEIVAPGCPPSASRTCTR